MGDFARAIAAVCRTEGPEWRQHGGLAPCVLFGLTLLLLPWLCPISLIDDLFVARLTHTLSIMFRQDPAQNKDTIYYWTLSGLVINMVSITVAMRMVFKAHADRFDQVFLVLYTAVLLISVLLLACFRWTAESLTYVFLGYYAIYVATDVSGWILNRRNPYERAKYMYPFFCMDFPALLTSVVILITAGQREFVDGMAAGHLVFGSFCYFGIAGLLLPFVLSRISRSERAIRGIASAEVALSDKRVDEAAALLQNARSELG